MDTSKLLFHVPLTSDLDPAVTHNDRNPAVDTRGEIPDFRISDGRAGAYFGPDCCVYYPVEGNFHRQSGTAMMWFRPDWSADYIGETGRILWDLRIEHGSVVRDDPSQRWALVYPNPKAEVSPGRGPRTTQRWRFCIATNRNLCIIGTNRRRPDSRTRQAVWGENQTFDAGTWLHLAVTWRSNSGEIYVNGVLSGRSVLPEGLPDKPLPIMMQLGAITSYINAGACGMVSDFRVYSHVLSQSGIREAMEAAP